MAKHIGAIIEPAECAHNALASLLTCVSALCVSLLARDTGTVELVGKHGVKYVRG